MNSLDLLVYLLFGLGLWLGILSLLMGKGNVLQSDWQDYDACIPKFGDMNGNLFLCF